STIYVAGGQQQVQNARSTRHFFSLNIAGVGDSLSTHWKSLPSWPGPPRILAVSAAQNDGVNKKFYLFSGRRIVPDQKLEVLKDVYVINPETQKWQTLGPIQLNKNDSTRSV